MNCSAWKVLSSWYRRSMSLSNTSSCATLAPRNFERMDEMLSSFDFFSSKSSCDLRRRDCDECRDFEIPLISWRRRVSQNSNASAAVLKINIRSTSFSTLLDFVASRSRAFSCSSTVADSKATSWLRNIHSVSSGVVNQLPRLYLWKNTGTSLGCHLQNVFGIGCMKLLCCDGSPGQVFFKRGISC